MSTKRAFTMVELIFVIVILGILAAVAVPKLNASREDAQKAALKANIITAMKDIQSYYAANGELASPTEMTNVPLIPIKCDVIAIADASGEPCLGLYKRGTSELAIYYYFKQSVKSSCDDAIKSPELRALLNDGTALADKTSGNSACAVGYSYKTLLLHYDKSAVEW